MLFYIIFTVYFLICVKCFKNFTANILSLKNSFSLYNSSKPIVLNPGYSSELPTEQLKLSGQGPKLLYFYQLNQIIMTCNRDRNHYSGLKEHRDIYLKIRSQKNKKTYLIRQTLNIYF